MSWVSKWTDEAVDEVEDATGLDVEGAIVGSLFGPGGTILGGLYGDEITDFINDPVGAKEAAKKKAEALREAGRIEEAMLLEARAQRIQILAETKQFRDQGKTELERLQGQTPGSTEFYKQALEKGSESIAEQRSRFGLTSSGGTGRKFEELSGTLLSQEELIRQQGIGRAAQLSQTGYGYGLQALQQEGGAAYRQAQTVANIGAAEAQADIANRNFWLSAGTQAVGLGAGYLLGGGAGAAAGGEAGSAAGTTASQGGYDYTLKEGTGYNQFQNPYLD